MLKYFEDRLKLTQTKLGLKHSQTLAAMFDLAEAYAAARRFADAEQQYRKCLTMTKDDQQVVVARRGLATCLLRQGKSDEGVEILQDLFQAKLRRHGTPDAVELHRLGRGWRTRKPLKTECPVRMA